MADRGQAAPTNQAAKASVVTPMMTQYLAIKEAHPDCLLFYRMGDFYELFFDDAVAASAALRRAGTGASSATPGAGAPKAKMVTRMMAENHRPNTREHGLTAHRRQAAWPRRRQAAWPPLPMR
mgnify:CR=1 FL=1